MKLLKNFLLVTCLLAAHATMCMLQPPNISQLHRAAAADNLNQVKALLEKGFSVNENDGHGFSPLVYAVRGNNKDVVQFLLDKKALHKNALETAAADGNTAMTKLLLDNGVKVNTTNMWGQTPLMIIAQIRSMDHNNPETPAFLKKLEETAIILLKYGADINQTNPADQTLLMLCLLDLDNPEIAPFLIYNDIDVSKKDTNRETALTYAFNRTLTPGLDDTKKEYYKKVIHLITQYANNDLLEDYPKEAFQLLNKPQQVLLNWLIFENADIKKIPKNAAKYFALDILLMPNVTPPSTFDKLLEMLQTKELEELVNNFLTQIPRNNKVLELLVQCLLNKLEKQDALYFLKFTQPKTKTAIEKFLNELIRGKKDFKNANLNFIEQLYLYAKLNELNTIGAMIRRYMTTISSTPRDGTGEVIASFEPTTNPLISPPLPKRKWDERLRPIKKKKIEANK